jgi:hypothetical protein
VLLDTNNKREITTAKTARYKILLSFFCVSMSLIISFMVEQSIACCYKV